MAITEIEVNSLGELVDRLTPAPPDPKSERRRDTGVYRGMADARWPLLTSLDQLGGTHPPHTKANLEEHILRNFIRYLPCTSPRSTVAALLDRREILLRQ